MEKIHGEIYMWALKKFVSTLVYMRGIIMFKVRKEQKDEEEQQQNKSRMSKSSHVSELEKE